MKAGVHFDPDRLADCEAASWRAYYDRNWLSVLRLMVQLMGVQLDLPFPRSLLAGYYVTRAAITWAPVEHDEQKTLSYLKKYYGLARRSADLPFAPDRAAQLELQYWAVHRRLAGTGDYCELVETLTTLHSELFRLSPSQIRGSAELRARAATVVDRITSGQSTDIEGDWALIQDTLRGCYRSIQRAATVSFASSSDV